VLGIRVADIENAGLKNDWEIAMKKCFKSSKRESAEAIKNGYKRGNREQPDTDGINRPSANVEFVGTGAK